MDVKIIPKIYSQQKLLNIFYQVFQSLQYHHLKAQKITIIYTKVKIVRKVLLIFKRACNKNN